MAELGEMRWERIAAAAAEIAGTGGGRVVIRLQLCEPPEAIERNRPVPLPPGKAKAAIAKAIHDLRRGLAEAGWLDDAVDTSTSLQQFAREAALSEALDRMRHAEAGVKLALSEAEALIQAAWLPVARELNLLEAKP